MEKYIISKLEEMQDAYLSLGDDQLFEYDLSKDKLEIKFGKFEFEKKYIIDLNTLETEVYYEGEGDWHQDHEHKDFTSIEEVLEHIEKEVGIFENKDYKKIKGFDSYINEKKRTAGRYKNQIKSEIPEGAIKLELGKNYEGRMDDNFSIKTINGELYFICDNGTCDFYEKE